MTCRTAEDGDEFHWFSTDLTFLSDWFVFSVTVLGLTDGQWYKELTCSALDEGLLGFCSPGGETIAF